MSFKDRANRVLDVAFGVPDDDGLDHLPGMRHAPQQQINWTKAIFWLLFIVLVAIPLLSGFIVVHRQRRLPIGKILGSSHPILAHRRRQHPAHRAGRRTRIGRHHMHRACRPRRHRPPGPRPRATRTGSSYRHA